MFVYWVKLLMNLVSIGEFTVDLAERRIFKAETELAAEPKVIEVLCYLIEHRERFVSLSELHDCVWAGRVVTDTAVRRTISKLRILLEDTDTDNARYIKSQMKRGYQLVCPLTQLNHSAAVIAPTASTSKTFNMRKSGYMAISGLLLVLLFCGYSVVSKQSYKLNEAEALLSVSGQKTSLAITKDGSIQAFIGRVSAERDWELFIYDTRAGQLRKVETPTKHLRYVNFIDNDTKLVYIGYEDAKAKLYTQSATNFTEPAVLHPTEDFSFLFGPVELPDNKLLLAAGNSLSDNIHYYKYDLVQHTFEQFTYSGKDIVQDAFAVVSPDQSLLALGRANLNEKNVKLHIYRLADKELVAEYPFQNDLKDFRLGWVDDANLLARTSAKHELIQINDGKRFDVLAEPGPMYEFRFSDKRELFALNYRVSSRGIYQAEWPFDGDFNKRFELDDSVTELAFSRDKTYLWLLETVNDTSKLYKYFYAENKRQLVMESTKPLSIQDQNSDGSMLLLKRDDRLELLDINTANTTVISIATQDVYTGNFSSSGQYVYFVEGIKAQKIIKKYDIANKTQSHIIAGYRYFAEFERGFVAADADGNVWLLNDELNRERLLYQGVLYDLNYQLSVQAGQLIIVYRSRVNDWVLSSVNIKTSELWQKRLPQQDFSKNFSIDPSGKKIIFITMKKEENQLVRFGYNFGYN